MHADYEELETLLEVQRVDLAIMKAKKARAELPQRIAVMRLRKKRAEIQQKLDQVLDLQKQEEAAFTVLEDDDRALAEKQERAQELIDAAGSDFRKVESHSREMAGAAKRREELAEKLEAATEQLNKVKAVRAQLEGAVLASQAEEKHMRASFEADDNALIDQVKQLSARREEAIAHVDPKIVSLYEDAAAKAGGVGIGKLEDGRCGVCRSVIDGGRLIDLRSQAPLGTCPTCNRLLVIE